VHALTALPGLVLGGLPLLSSWPSGRLWMAST